MRQFVDVTIRHPRALKYLARAAGEDGAAAAMAEQAKRIRYPPDAAAGLLGVVPFAVESYGRLGESGLQLLRDAHQRLLEAQAPVRGWAGVALFQRWLALFSCNLIRAPFEASQAIWGETGPVSAALPAGLAGAPLLAAVLPFA